VETREGIIKHSGTYDRPESGSFIPEEQPSLEAQIIDQADEIAYNNHDLDDGLASGILRYDEVKNLEMWRMAVERYGRPLPSSVKSATREVIRTIINLLVSDLIDSTEKNIAEKNIKSYMDVKKAGGRTAAFSGAITAANSELKNFLRDNLYRNYHVTRVSLKSQRVINDLFTIYTEHPETMPDRHREEIERQGLIRTVTDFIAGMTDRYALEEHRKLTDPLARV